MKEPIDELRRLESQFDFLLRFANDIILLMDEEGNLLEANEVAVNTYGWSLEELLTFNIRALRDPSTLGEVEAQLRLTAENGAVFETRHQRRDGSTFPVEVSTRVFEHEGKPYRQSIIRDITQRNKMQSKLERDAKRFEGLLKLHELAMQLPEKEFMQSGLEWVEKLAESKIAFIYFVNEDQQSIELAAWSAAAGDKDFAPGCDDSYAVAQAGIWADCLRLHQPVIFNDYASHPALRGLPEPPLRLIGVPVIEGGRVQMILGVGGKETDYDAEDIEIAQLFGNDMWRIIRRQRLETDLKNNLELQRALNSKLEEAHNHLLHSEKMASLGLLSAGMAHELNNPVGFVYSNMGTLENYVKDIFQINAAYEEVEQSVEGSCPALERVHKLKQEKDYAFIKQDIFQLIEQSADGLTRMRKIVQDLKDFSRVGDEDWSWADLHKGIDSTVNIVWNELKYKCRVVKEYGSIPAVWCMASKINQVLLNLLVNAGQSIESGGVITIRTGLDSATEEVWVEVADNGQGIKPEDIDHIFDPFFTTKPVGVGTGLGLSLSYGIIKSHQGRFEVKSEIGTGTTMRIYLPVKPFPG